jgi:hypothetical protein
MKETDTKGERGQKKKSQKEEDEYRSRQKGYEKKSGVSERN